MRRWIVCAVLLFGLALPTLRGAADDTPTSGSPAVKPEAPKQRLIPAGQLLGEITKVTDNGKMITVRMHQKVPQLSFNPMYRPNAGCAT